MALTINTFALLFVFCDTRVKKTKKNNEKENITKVKYLQKLPKIDLVLTGNIKAIFQFTKININWFTF